MNKLEIFDMAIEQLPEILAIERDCFLDDAWSERMFLELFEQPLSHNLCIINEFNEILGYLIFYDINPEIEIINLAVKSTMRNKKIGSVLMSCVIDYAQECGLSRIILDVRQSNIPAINLYTKFGFKVDGIRKNYYNFPKENALLMSLDL